MYLKKKTIICSPVSRHFYYCVADEALVFIVFLVTRDTHITSHVYGNKHITGIHNLVPRSPTAKGKGDLTFQCQKQSEIWVRDYISVSKTE